MNSPSRPSMDELLTNPKDLEADLCRAVRQATLLHAQLGHPVATWHDGQVVWLQPAEVFALLGHKPENGDGERGTAPTNLDGTITL